jgi:hypothetical protein
MRNHRDSTRHARALVCAGDVSIPIGVASLRVVPPRPDVDLVERHAGGEDQRSFATAAGDSSAVRMPLKIRVGLGGHPGIATSTGITFETRPRVA